MNTTVTPFTLNCDLGEGLDDIDKQVMPLIDLASIACGGHAGNESSMQKTVALARKYNKQIGAHPSYDDRENFGRISQNPTSDTLAQTLKDQINALKSVTDQQGVQLCYIKPHGALYNDIAQDPTKRTVMFDVAKSFGLPLMLMSKENNYPIKNEAKQRGINLLFEGFADRGYEESGQLTPRAQNGALLTQTADIEQRLLNIMDGKGVISRNGQPLLLTIDSLCVHSDTPGAIETIQTIRSLLDERSHTSISN